MAVDSSRLTLVIPHGPVPLRIMSLEQVGNTKRHPLPELQHGMAR